MATFAELGINFPLFEAPADHVRYFAGLAVCTECKERRECFDAGTHTVWKGKCLFCGTQLEQSEKQRTAGGNPICQTCGTTITVSTLIPVTLSFFVCCKCIRFEEMLIPKDTEFGVVWEENAVKGVTDGVPGLVMDQFEVIPTNDDDWDAATDPTEQNRYKAAIIPSEQLWELLRTPDYGSWQGGVWLFCCSRPMTYLGHWLDLVNLMKPEDPDVLFETI